MNGSRSLRVFLTGQRREQCGGTGADITPKNDKHPDIHAHQALIGKKHHDADRHRGTLNHGREDCPQKNCQKRGLQGGEHFQHRRRIFHTRHSARHGAETHEENAESDNDLTPLGNFLFFHKHNDKHACKQNQRRRFF